MTSKFDTKFEAALDKVAQSAKAQSWKRPLFWVVAAAFVLFAILKETLEGLFEATENIKQANPLESHLTEEYPDGFGYKPGDIFYSKPGGMNPILAEMYEKTDDSGTAQNNDW